MRYQYKREPLLPDQINALVNACEGHREKLAICALLDTGLRVSELAGLRKDMVDWQGGRIHVHGKGGPFGSRTKRRVLQLTPRVRALLEVQYAVYDRLGASSRTIERIVLTVGRRAGLTKRCTPHVLRHTFAVESLRRGISLPALMKALGHDRLETTAIYLNLSPEHMLEEYRTKWGAA